MNDILKQIEDLLEKVSVQGEENWRRMTLAKEGLRNLRKQVQKAVQEQKKGESADGTGADAAYNGQAEADAGAV